MIPALVNLIIILLVIGILYAVAEYVISNLIPDPPAKIARVALIVIIALVIILLLLDLAGVNTGMSLPKVTS